MFGGLHYVSNAGIPWRLRVGVSLLTGVGGDTTGSNITPYASLWMPLSETVFLGIGGGFTWSSGSFMQQRFGVTSADAALTGLPEYTPSAGVRQAYAWPAIIVRLNRQWFAATGVFYQRLTGDAANSPIVTQRGDRNQWTAGGGIGYAW
jgi:outer membrane protein